MTCLLLVPQTTNTISKEKWGPTRINHAYQEASANVGPQKTLNVVYNFQAMVALKNSASFDM
jgi:hypothetical protein